MKRSTILLLFLVIVLLVTGPAWNFQQNPKDVQAIVVKVINDVNKKGPTTGWTRAVPMERLRSGYQINTGEGSLALIRFADETKLVVRSKSIVEIRGQLEGKQFVDRNVHVDRGNVQFNVKKQEKEQFRFSSPTSVASIRGTSGEFASQVSSMGDGGKGGGAPDGERNDRLIILEGLATLLNLISNQSMDVLSNQTGESNSRGVLNVRRITPGERDHANRPPTKESAENERDEDAGAGTHFKKVDLPENQQSKNPMVITATLAQGTTAAKATLFYRQVRATTADAYKSIEMNLSGLSLTGRVPREDVGSPALDFYLKLELADNTTETYPAKDAENNPIRIMVRGQKIQLRVQGEDKDGNKKDVLIEWEE